MIITENPVVVNTFIGLMGAAGGSLFTLYVKDKAREIVNEELEKRLSGLFATFKTDLMETLDTTYRRSAECILMHNNYQVKIDEIENRLVNIENLVNHQES